MLLAYAINQVRKRAGLPSLTPGLSAQAFRDSVVYERAYKFAGEFGVRWFDIVRLQLLPKIVAARSLEENPIPANTDFSQKYLAPIPVANPAIATARNSEPFKKKKDGNTGHADHESRFAGGRL